jgi:hypothetical protein
MVDLPLNRYPLKWMSGEAERTAVYALLDVNGSDVADVYQEFSVVKRAVVIGTTVAAAASMSVNGTEVTVPAGANRDAAFMMVFGAAAGV